MGTLIGLWLGWLAATSPLPSTAPARAELVMVDGLGPISLEPFDCVATPRSSEVARICHDAARGLALAEVNGRMRAWCEVDAALVRDWLAAPSMGRFLAERVAPAHRCD